jgi:hypothetical protein
MTVTFSRISTENGQWPELIRQWELECERYDEALDDYATASIPTVRPLAEQAQTHSAGVYALKSGDSFLGLCQLNVALLPGYDGRVLRVRHIVHSPKFDFDADVPIEEYVSFLAGVLVGVFTVSDNDMQAPYVKFHFKSPAEKAFFAQLQVAIKKIKGVDEVALKGSWLYIKKVQA